MICDFVDFVESWAVFHCILGVFADSIFDFGVCGLLWGCLFPVLILRLLSVCYVVWVSVACFSGDN